MSLPAGASQLEAVLHKASFDNLYKELQRKDRRNDGLAKELKEARSRRDELQKELNMLSKTHGMRLSNYSRILGAVFDKVNQERSHFEQELKKYQEQLKNSGSSAQDASMVKKLEYKLYIKDRQLAELEKELSHHQRLKQIKDSTFSELNKSESETVIESLCDEVGKHKSDAHGLALTLAEVHRDLMTTQSEFLKTKAVNGEHNDKIRELRNECDRLSAVKANQMTEILSLHKQLMKEVEVNGRLSKQVEDLSSRLTDERNESSRTVAGLQARCKEVTDELILAQSKVEAYSRRLASAEAQEESLLSLYQASEEVLRKERLRGSELESMLKERECAIDELEASVLALHGNLEAALQENEALKRAAEQSSGRQRQWDSERDRFRASMNALLEEIDELKAQRDEGLRALRETVESVKHINSQLGQERDAKYAS